MDSDIIIPDPGMRTRVGLISSQTIFLEWSGDELVLSASFASNQVDGISQKAIGKAFDELKRLAAKYPSAI